MRTALLEFTERIGARPSKVRTGLLQLIEHKGLLQLTVQTSTGHTN